MNDYEQLQEAINNSHRIVLFGGAGVSTESGIPDFRSANGIFMQNSGIEYRPEEIISYSFYKQHPKEFFDFHFQKLVYEEAEPNITHTFMADLEINGKDVTIVTQNIDGLHQKAGSQKVLELHGNVFEYYCEACGEEYTLNNISRDGDGIPRCKYDQGIVRPNIVMYEETLNLETLNQSIQAISQADLLIVAGTSLVVYPAAGLLHYFNGDNLVVINKTPLNIVKENALFFEKNLSEVFKQLSID